MKNLDRTLLALVLAIAIALGWSWVSRTDWAATVSIVSVGEDYENALQPIVKVAAAIIVMVTATELVQMVSGFIKERGINCRAQVRTPSR